MKPRQNVRHDADTYEPIFIKENVCNLITISLAFAC